MKKKQNIYSNVLCTFIRGSDIMKRKEECGRGEYMENIQNENFYNKVIELFQNAKKNLSAAANMTMVYSYYEEGG